MTLDPDRYHGCLLGLATGDALGTPLEFKRPGSSEPIGDMVGGGPFRLQPGQWTDDTSMALCLAESLLECARPQARLIGDAAEWPVLVLGEQGWHQGLVGIAAG